MAENKIIEAKRNEMVDLILASIENDKLQWEKGWVSLGTGQINGATQKNYRGINALYLAFLSRKKGYKDNRWVTFNQAKELGASIKKGEKSAPIFFYERYDSKTKKAFDSQTIQDLSEDEQKDYIKENVYTVVKYSYVFNAEQCINFPENEKPLESNETERAKQNELIERIIANSHAPIRYDGGDQAFYDTINDSIHLPEIKAFSTMQDYYATALHEIAHSTGHESRLNREISNKFASKEYAIEELRAELASVFIQMDNGITLEGKHLNNHTAYLASWFDEVKNDKKIFLNAVKDAMKISDYVTENYSKSEHTQSNESTKESSNDSASVLFDLEDSELLIQIKNADNQFAKVAIDGKEYFYKIDQEGKIVGLSEPMPGGQEVTIDELSKLGRSKYDFIASKTQRVLQERYPQSQTFSSESRERVKEEVINAINYYQYESDKNSYSFQQQVDAVLHGSIENSHIVVRTDTPEILQQVGMKNLPILITAKHIKTITSESGNDDSVNYHGIESEVLKKLPVLIEEPIMILESLTRPQDSIVAVTSMVDSQNRPIICSVMFNGVGQQNNEIIEANIVTSVYGRNNFNEFISNCVNYNKVLYWSKEKCREMSVNPGVQFPDVMASLSSDTIIRKASAFVNSNVKNNSNNMQKATLESQTTSQQKWQSINIDARYVCTTYGTSTMIKMPEESVYKHFATFVPTSLLKKQDDGSYKLMYNNTKENSYKIKNDGLETSLSPEQLQQLYDGTQIQYDVVRVRPSKRNLDVIERIKENTPPEMASQNRWTVHRRYWNSSANKYVKQIFNAKNIDDESNNYAKCNDSATWCSFEEAIDVAKTNKKNMQGLTYVLGGGVSCIDLDHCFDDSGRPTELAVELVKAFKGTYIERSMSGSGLHIFVKGDLRNNDQFSNRNSGTFGDIEVYDDSKFMSLTGDVYGIKSSILTTVTEKQQQVVQKYLIDKLALSVRKVEEHSPSKSFGVAKRRFGDRTDDEVIEAIRRSKKGSDFDSLMSGSLTGDRSRDDYRLMSILAYFTNGDRQQTERIYRQSQLFRPNKPQKYYDTTLDKVFQNVRFSNYQPGSSSKSSGSGQNNNSK